MTSILHNRVSNDFVRRSILIFPVNVKRFLDKAYLREADCIVMDLEDSVPLDEKDAARRLIKDSIPIVGKGGGDIAVRINQPLDMAKADLEASIWPGLTCVTLPKVESMDEVLIRDKIITELEKRRGIKVRTTQLAVTVETPLGVVKAFEIASASPRIVTIQVGAEDLTQEMGIKTSESGKELWYTRSKVLIDAYAAGIHPLGIIGVDPFSWKDPEKIFSAAVNSRMLGFIGAQSIHPAPIPHLNRGFSIPDEEVADMKRALKAFEDGVAKGTASVNVNGRMIDIASAERCRKVLFRANAISKMEKRKEDALMNPDYLEEKLKSNIE
jgi:citrate lyase subunit beta/citryl-CoA lyase